MQTTRVSVFERLRRREDGQAAAEMALVLPLLVALFLAIAQLGIAWNNYVTLTDATRAGARAAAVGRFATNPVGNATTAVRSSAANLTQSKLTVTVTPPAGGWTASGSDVSVTASYPYSINILGWTVKSGTISSTTTERLE